MAGVIPSAGDRSFQDNFGDYFLRGCDAGRPGAKTSRADSLKLKAFKSGEKSVMIVRNHTFAGRDIEKPY